MATVQGKITVIVVAGGRGKRMAAKIPKQFLLLRNYPIVMHTLTRIYDAFKNYDLKIILALNPKYFDYWQQLKIKYNFSLPIKEVPGGKERFHSVQNALNFAPGQGIIAVHDAVRPLITKDFLLRGLKKAQRYSNAVPYVLPKSSVRIEQNSKNFPFDRNKVRLIQTPQFFDAKKLKLAYQTDFQPEFTDDATVYERLGEKIYLFPGLETNIKITTELDLHLAEILIEE